MGKVKFVALLAFAAGFFVPGVHSCDDGWIAMGASCYKTSPDPLTWFQAEQVFLQHFNLVQTIGYQLSFFQYCRLEGSYLIEINDEYEQVKLVHSISCAIMGQIQNIHSVPSPPQKYSL